MFARIKELLFPRKCVFCCKILSDQETDLCAQCRKSAPEYRNKKKSIPFVAGWTAVWYYRDNVRRSIIRYKFYGKRNYHVSFGRFLAMRILNEGLEQPDILTWVPVSAGRKRKRGYDQVELLAQSVGKELGLEPVAALKKIRNVKPQSRLHDESARRANILGAYCVRDGDFVAGKRILLLDDVITTGSTVSECAKTLLLAGAKEVYCAALAAAEKD